MNKMVVSVRAGRKMRGKDFKKICAFVVYSAYMQYIYVYVLYSFRSFDAIYLQHFFYVYRAEVKREDAIK